MSYYNHSNEILLWKYKCCKWSVLLVHSSHRSIVHALGGWKGVRGKNEEQQQADVRSITDCVSLDLPHVSQYQWHTQVAQPVSMTVQLTGRDWKMLFNNKNSIAATALVTNYSSKVTFKTPYRCGYCNVYMETLKHILYTRIVIVLLQYADTACPLLSWAFPWENK